MTTTITSPLGNGLVMAQAGSYDAIDVRRAATVGLQEGVIDAGSYEVTQRAAGVGMFVDIAATVGDGALVQGDSVTGQALYTVAAHSALITEAITAAHATLPRVDRVVLECLDHAHDASGSSLARVRVIDGTATGGATLDNLSGAAAVPNSALLLADVHVPAADTTISNSQIRDRRKWARGAFNVITRSSASAEYTTTGSLAEIDATNLKPRITCSGVPLRVTLSLDCLNSTANCDAAFDLFIDSVARGQMRLLRLPVTGQVCHVELSWVFTPTAGSHRIAPAYSTSVGTLRVFQTAGEPLIFTVEEIVRQNTPNNATTTG